MKSFFARFLPVLIVGSLLLAACSVSPTAAPVPATDGGGSGQGNPSSAEVVATIDPNGYPAPEKINDPNAYPAPEETGAAAAVYPNPVPEGALFLMTLPDGSVVYPAAGDLSKLPQTEITAGGQSKTGVKIRDLLAAYNITEFRSFGADAPNNSILLTSDKVTDETILEQTGEGAVNLVSSSLPADQWILGVTKIKVE